MISLSCSACRSLLALILLLTHLQLSAQKEPSIWLFGDHNGLNFTSGSPAAITNPNISYHGSEVRGVGTATDANGNLLFYLENETIYNSQHDTMQNGAKLKSVWCGTQTGLIVRAIHDTSLYYVFTTNSYEINGQSYQQSDLWYSIVDMKANNGLGAVISKNVPLFNKSTTQLCAIRHCNERDIWIVTHERESDAYYAFLITPSGVNTTPVISRSGRQVTPTPPAVYLNEFGYMKGSPNGKKLAASWPAMGLDLSDFDNATGVVSNSINLNLMNNYWAYANGVEFSPNSGVLYANFHVYSTSFLYQYNVNAGSAAAVIASKTKIEEIDLFGYFAGMQRGPDNKIYIATYMQPYLSVINNPDVIGTGCNYVLEGVALMNRSSHGLPAYMESRFYPEPLFTHSSACPPELVQFDYDKPDNVVSVKWDFDDPSSGNANTSTALNPVHEFTADGTYNVKLIRFLACSSDTLEEEVVINKMKVDLGEDLAICKDSRYLLEPAISPSFDFLWQDGSTGSSLYADAPGVYWLEITDPVTGCTARDSINVTITAQPQFSLGADKEVCDTAVLLEGPVNAASYLWSTGNTGKDITASTSGSYWLQVQIGQCFYRDTIGVTLGVLSIDLGPDVAVCGGDGLILKGPDPNLRYTWQDGSTGTTFYVDAPGLYRVTATNGNCTATDSIRVTFNDLPKIELGADKEICGDEIITLGDDLPVHFSYRWEDGSTSALRNVNRSGTYILTATNECGSRSDTIVILEGVCKLGVPNAFSPNGDGKNDVFSISRTKPLSSFTMQVFNRWGQKIFESKDQSKGWSGKFAGKMCDVGHYAYLIQYRDDAGTPVTLKGMVLLVR